MYCLGWTYPCDLWSIGCILVELCLGEALFQTHDNLEHLAMMERVLGPLPEHMICRASRGAEKYFKRGSRLNWPEGAVSRESIRAVKKLDYLKDMVSHVDYSRSSLIDLLHGLLKFDPLERLTARQALDHPLFKNPSTTM
uniref:Protein kinase domain-containing protein n=1 Tax=Davidia involucrata TaxID=16924 RepID=A0A5B6YRK5_DAVIN